MNKGQDPPIDRIDLAQGHPVSEPPPDLDTPTFQGPIEGAPGRWRRAYVDADGNIDVDEFPERIEDSARSAEEIVRQNLGQLLEEHGWSAREATRRLRTLSRGTQFKSDEVQRILSGRRKVHLEDLCYLCELFGIALWRLLLPPADQHLLVGRTVLGRDGASETLFHLPGASIDEEMENLRAQHIARRERRRALLKELELDQLMAISDEPESPTEYFERLQNEEE